MTFHTTLCFAPSDMKSVKRAFPNLENGTQPATTGEPSARSVYQASTLHHLRSYIPAIDAGDDRLTISTSVHWFDCVTHAPWPVFLCLWEKIVSPPADVKVYSWVYLAAVVLPSLFAASKMWLNALVPLPPFLQIGVHAAAAATRRAGGLLSTSNMQHLRELRRVE